MAACQSRVNPCSAPNLPITAAIVHLICTAAGSADDLLHEAAHELDEHFGIHNATLQLETGDGEHACRLAPDEVV